MSRPENGDRLDPTAELDSLSRDVNDHCRARSNGSAVAPQRTGWSETPNKYGRRLKLISGSCPPVPQEDSVSSPVSVFGAACLISSDHQLLENSSVGFLSRLVEELPRRQVAEARMRLDHVVVLSPDLDKNLGLCAAP